MASNVTLVDRVKLFIASSGTGPFVLGGAAPGFRGAEALTDGATYAYAVGEGFLYEVGTGVYVSSSNQLIRTPELSSNGNAAVAFPVNSTLSFTARAADLVATGGTFPIANALGNDPGVAIAQQAATAAINSKLTAATLTASSGAGLVGTPDGNLQANLNTRPIRVTSRATLKALNISRFAWVELDDTTTPGRSGMFLLRAGSPPTDTLEGLYLVSTTSGYYWERIWDGLTGYAEWWGAVRGGPDCGAAINAAISFCPITQLLTGDYYTTIAIVNAKSDRTLWGAGQHYVSAGDECTRILTASATLDPIVQVGANSFPAGGVNNLIRGCRMADIFVGRTTGPNIAGRVAGVRMQYVLGAQIDRVKSVDSILSFHIRGTVACYMRNTNANRVTAGTGSGTDTWEGYSLDGSINIGLAGGNASLYMSETQAGCNIGSLQTGSSYGYRATGKPQDLFMFKPESVSCNVGLSIEGDGSGGGDADIKIFEPVMDAPFKWGLYFNNLSIQSTVNVIDLYVGVNSSTQFAVYTQSCQGSLNILGGEILGGGFNVQGVAFIDTRGATIRDTILKEIGGTGVGANGTCSSLVIDSKHDNPTVSGGAAVQLQGSVTASKVQAVAKGKSSAFTFGIQTVGTGDARNLYEMSGFDSGCIAGGSPNKLVRNGTQVTAVGLSGSNYVSGVMG